MAYFNLGSLRQWQSLATGELLAFPLPAVGFRQVDFDLMADSFVTVHAFAGDDSWLVAAGEGLISVRFGVADNVSIAVSGDKDAHVMIRTKCATQVMPENPEPTFTTIEPRPAGPSAEFQRMWQVMQINNRQREQALQHQLQSLQGRMDALVQAAPAAPVPDAPAPAPVLSDGADDAD